MNVYATPVRMVPPPALLFLIWSFAGSLEASVTTNWVDRWFTNPIAVHLPMNHFVNEYRTNWIELSRTNHIDFFVTNWATRNVTNPVTIAAFRTNQVTAYLTNWNTVTLTNWETVMVFKTNWVNQTVTNMVQLDVTNSSVPEATAADAKPGPLATNARKSLFALQATRTARAAGRNQAEVQLKIKWNSSEPEPILRIEQWRVERADGAILCFGQDSVFKRELPFGTYKVQVRILRDEERPVTARGTLTLTPNEALIQQLALK